MNVANIIPDDIKRATYIATLSWLPESASSIPNTKLIQFFSAGTNHVSSHPIYTDSKIPLCSANGVHGPQIAEWVIMMNLVHSHSYTKLYDNQKNRIWDQKVGNSVSDRVGKRVGILGYGSIGRQGMFNQLGKDGETQLLLAYLLHMEAILIHGSRSRSKGNGHGRNSLHSLTTQNPRVQARQRLHRPWNG